MARRTWFPDLPEAFVDNYYAEKADQNSGILNGATGSILNPMGTAPTAEEQRQAQFAIYWAWWSSPEFQERLNERRALGEI